ncbi:proline rich transmembrane protein 1B-like [Watersipora subatra]|uniref:proline rich transmembrane protein 1B-like n=1 Tax=Watersipora subatra TaxID=2589382 RepID=UPI00355C5C8F
MTSQVGVTMTKEEEANAPVSPPAYAPLPSQTAVPISYQVEHVPVPTSSCWYVLGVLATIFCCLPCGIVGLVHAMIGQHEAERGNVQAHRRRMYQAKCWTSWSIALGLLVLVLLTVWAVLGYIYYYGWDDDYYYKK